MKQSARMAMDTTRWPTLHRLLISLGAIESVIAGSMLILTPSLVMHALLLPPAAAVLGIQEPGLGQEAHHLLLSTIGALLIFYGFVMAALAVRFDARSLRIKGGGEIFSGILLAWISWSYSSLLEPWLALLAAQHIIVGVTYFATTKSLNMRPVFGQINGAY